MKRDSQKLLTVRFRLLSIWCLSLISISLFAGPVTQEQALEKARQFMKNKIIKEPRLMMESGVGKNTSTGEQAFYVFNAIGDNGFVIVSGDDRTAPILGYADKGAINMSHMPENLQNWLAGYAEQISALKSSGVPLQTANPSWAAIDPLIDCYWGQSEPYNLQCPVYDGEHSVTGCVATAMAQVMYYHKWPETTSMEIPAYTSTYYVGKNYSSNLPALPITTFSWNLMKPTYKTNEVGEAADEVAKLMRYCGQAVKMKYSPSVSGANLNAEHMVKYFGYSTSAKDVCRADYFTEEWEELIYHELSNNRPVPYSGSSSSGGHQFLCDGYDGNGLFHINWGWNGTSDGFFVLSVLNPNVRGVGGGTAEDGYTHGQWAMVGLKPSVGNEVPAPTVYVYQLSLGQTQYSRNSSTEDFTSIGVYSSIYSNDASGNVDHAWGLYKDGECIAVLGLQSNIGLTQNTVESTNATVSFGANLPDGEYELYDIYRAVGTDDWYKAVGVGTSHFIASISDNTLTLNFSSNQEGGLVVNSVLLKGDYKTGRPMSAVMNLTNQNHSHEQTFYLWEGGTKIGRISTYIDYGQTQEGTFYFVPSTAGSITYKITSDSNGSNILWSNIVDIVETTAQSLQGSIDIEGMKNDAIAGTTIRATVTLRNIGNKEFADDVYFIVYPRDDFSAVTQQVRRIRLSAGESTSVQIEFPDLQANTEYFVDVQYYNKIDNQVQLDYAAWSTCKVGYNFVPVKLGFTVNVTNSSSAGKIYGTTIKANVLLENIGENAYNDRITVYLLKQEANTWNYKTYQENNVELAVGETETIPVEFSDLEIGGEYKLYVYYYPENKQSWGGSSLVYTATADEAISFADEHTKAICVANWDTNGDGELSMSEAALVDNLGEVFKNNTEITSFDELQHFSGINAIGSAAFSGCSSLGSVVIPENVKSIGTAAFSGCSSLTSVTVKWLNPLTIDSECFTNRANATLNVPLTGVSAYQAADYWKEFHIVGVDANISFAESAVKAICVSNWDTNSDGELSMSEAAAVTDLGTVFQSKNTIVSFNELQYFTGLTTIGNQAFYNCSSLTSIIIPANVTTIDDWAFAYCSNLLSITIPRSVTSITGNILQGCYRLAAINVDENNTQYDSRDHCNAIIHTSTNTLISGCMNTVIPNTVTTIGNTAFNGIQWLKSITIPSSVTSIGNAVFNGCNDLDFITVESGNTVFDSREGCNAIIRKTGNYLICGSNNTIIPAGVVSIGDYAFSNRTGLTSVVIPNSVKYIESGAFSSCYNLASVTIPNSVTSISSWAFSGCSSLVSVRVEKSTPVTISAGVFSNRANATLYVPVGSKAAYQEANYWKEFKAIVEMGDLNGDGQMTAQDASLVLQHVAGKTPIDENALKAADINGDGEVTAQDASLVLQKVAGKID